ncbi:MAG: DUF3795 domain-containing protein [Bacteroidales bacterium]|nr:DUF3795 domain-containing protein [Bacteroidales bacterium]
MDNAALKYDGFVPPCGIFCGGCPVYIRDTKRCEGAEKGCKKRKCKGIYVCCIEKKELEFCYQCKSYPCARYRQFADRWKKYGQDLLTNQDYIKQFGKEQFIEMMNNKGR